MNTLVLIGQHKEEANFGNLVRRLMKNKIHSVLFYRIVNGYNNSGRGTSREIKRVHREIIRKMEEYQPKITINIHTSKGDPNWWDVELFTLREYEKMSSLKRAFVKSFPVTMGGVHISNDYPRDGENYPLFAQEKFPIVTLENYLVKGHLRNQVEFAGQVIREITDLYRNQKP